MSIRRATAPLDVELPEADQQVFVEFQNLIEEFQSLGLLFHSLDSSICRRLFRTIDGCSEDSWKNFCEDLGFDYLTQNVIKVTGPLRSSRFEFWSEYAYNEYASNIEKEEHRYVQLWELLQVLCNPNRYFPVMKEIFSDLKRFVEKAEQKKKSSDANKIPEESSDLSLIDGAAKQVEKDVDSCTDISSGMQNISLKSEYDSGTDSGFGSSLHQMSGYAEPSHDKGPTCHSTAVPNVGQARDHSFVIKVDKDVKNDAYPHSGYRGVDPNDTTGPLNDYNMNRSNSWNPTAVQRDSDSHSISILITHSEDSCQQAYELMQHLQQVMNVHIYCEICPNFVVDPTGYEATLLSSIDIVVPLLSNQYLQDIQPLESNENATRSEHSIRVRRVFENMEMQFRENQSQNFRVQPICMHGITRNNIPAPYRYSILRFPQNFRNVIANPNDFYRFLVVKKQLINENDAF